MITYRNHLGLTLIELLLTVVISAILLSIAVPSFNEITRSYEADNLETRFFKLFRFARAEAINRQSVMTVCPLASDGSCATEWSQPVSVFVDTNGNANLDSSENIVRVFKDEKPDWTFKKLPGSRAHFQWNALGTSNGTAGSLQACKPKDNLRNRALIVSFSGRVRTSVDYNGDGREERSPGTLVNCG